MSNESENNEVTEMEKIEILKKKYETAIERSFKIAEENSPVRVKAEYIGCKNCGSKLAKKYVSVIGKTCKCPLCKESLFSKTAQERIKNAEKRACEIKKELESEQKKVSIKKQKQKNAFTEALERVRDRFDYVLEEHTAPDFREVIGKIGGDVLRFRVYLDGSVYEK